MSGSRSRRAAVAAGCVFALVAALWTPVGALAGAEVPFAGSDVGGFTFPGACGPDSVVVDIAGTGNGTHVGRYTYVALECFDTVTLLYSGAFTLEAANGDTIAGTYEGEVIDIDVVDGRVVGTYEQDAAVTGGTGRFAGASGLLRVQGKADLTDPANFTYTQHLSGAISSPGAARR